MQQYDTEESIDVNKGINHNPKAMSLAKQLMSNQNDQIEAYKKKLGGFGSIDLKLMANSIEGNPLETPRRNIKVQFKQQDSIIKEFEEEDEEYSPDVKGREVIRKTGSPSKRTENLEKSFENLIKKSGSPGKMSPHIEKEFEHLNTTTNNSFRESNISPSILQRTNKKNDEKPEEIKYDGIEPITMKVTLEVL